MWRRGDVVYALVVLAALVAEAVALGSLTLAFAMKRVDLLSSRGLATALLGAVVITGVVFVVLATYTLGYHHASDLSQQRVSDEVRAWTERWTRIVLSGEPAPLPPLSRAAEEALLSLREILRGEEGDKALALLQSAGVEVAILKRLTSRSVSRQLDALEALTRAKLPAALPHILPLLQEREDVVRIMAARAASHTLAAMPEGPSRSAAASSFAAAVRSGPVAPGVLGESFLLLEDAAPEVLAELFGLKQSAPSVRRAGLDAIGRLGLLPLAYVAAECVKDKDAEVRAAALRALARMGRIPGQAREDALAALHDPVEFVRVHAARTVGHLPGAAATKALWELLADPSWFVRRGAGEALLGRGPEGEAEVQRASREHPDRYARELCAQLWADAHELVPS